MTLDSLFVLFWMKQNVTQSLLLQIPYQEEFYSTEQILPPIHLQSATTSTGWFSRVGRITAKLRT